MDIEELMNSCLAQEHLPISRYMVDWMNGYLDFFKRDTDFKWENGNPVTDMEILQRLMACKSDEEIWSLMSKGIGDIKALFLWYKGMDVSPILEDATGIPCYHEKDEQKASDFLEYLINDSTVVTDSVRNEAMNLKKMADNLDRLREISKDLKTLFAELNIENPLETVFVWILPFVMTITV